MKLVEAQQARQILDRLVGFELSPVIWQKVPGGKSAGRVQSPAVRLVAEREDEIKEFISDFDFKVEASLETNLTEFKAELAKNLKEEAEAHEFLDKLNQAKLTIMAVENKPSERNPQAPFTTSALQQTANAKLGFSSKQTMSSAQRLYQAGHITYMRTDSVNLSGVFLKATHDFVSATYGEDYVKIRKFRTKSAGAQEAHEAIRPTNIKSLKAGASATDQRLYDLIRKRTLASQMAPAKIEKTVVSISLDNDKRSLIANGEVVLFDGFLKVWGNSEMGNKLPNLKIGDNPLLVRASAKQTFKKAPARYTEGSLVKKLEELGIGRPSTYATIVDTIQSRNYVEKGVDAGEKRSVIVLKSDGKSVNREIMEENYGSNKGRLVSTAIGKMISDFLINHFNQVVDYNFTANIESEFDEVARGELDRNKMLKDFYQPFHALVISSKDVKRSDVANVRLVGQDPKTKEPIYARFGRFGPMLQMGDGKDDSKPRFVPMPKGTKIESVTLEEAVEAFKLPRNLGKTKDGDGVKVNVGRFGPYAQVGKTNVSIKPHDPMTISLKEVLELYDDKLKKDADKIVADWNSIKIIRGPYGPYVTDGKKNAKIAKSQDPTKLTETEARELLDKAPNKSRSKKRPGRKTTKSKATKK